MWYVYILINTGQIFYKFNIGKVDTVLLKKKTIFNRSQK